MCKDGRIRIYEPLGPTGSQPKIEGGDIVVKKGARILWVLDDEYLIVTGFSRYKIEYFEKCSAILCKITSKYISKYKSNHF